MAKNSWYRFFPHDYAVDTAHLTWAEHGLYRAMIDAAMMLGGALPTDEDRLRKLLGITLREWRQYAPAVLPFWQIVDPVEAEYAILYQSCLLAKWGPVYSQKRVLFEIRRTINLQARSSAGGKAKAKADKLAKSLKTNKAPDAKQTAKSTPNPSQTTNQNSAKPQPNPCHDACVPRPESTKSPQPPFPETIPNNPTETGPTPVAETLKAVVDKRLAGSHENISEGLGDADAPPAETVSEASGQPVDQAAGEGELVDAFLAERRRRWPAAGPPHSRKLLAQQAAFLLGGPGATADRLAKALASVMAESVGKGEQPPGSFQAFKHSLPRTLGAMAANGDGPPIVADYWDKRTRDEEHRVLECGWQKAYGAASLIHNEARVRQGLEPQGATWARILDDWDGLGGRNAWNTGAYGPPPGAPDCLMPADLAAEIVGRIAARAEAAAAAASSPKTPENSQT